MYYYRRKTSPLKWFIIIVIVLAIAGFGYWFYQNYFSKIDFPKNDLTNENLNTNIETENKILKANIVQQSGIVEVVDTQASLTKAADNQAVEAGFTVKTGIKSQAVIKLDNGTVLRLNENTEIKIQDLAEKNTIIEQIRGRVYHNLYLGGKYQLKYNLAVVTALSTKFETIVNEDLKYLAVLDLENKVQVEVVDHSETIWAVMLEPGEKALLSLRAAKKDLLKIETFDVKQLAKESWYKWNFDLDAGMGDSLLEQEPDFAEVTDSLVLAAENKDNGVYLSWSVYPAADFKSYQLVRSEKNSELKFPDDPVIKVSTSKEFNSFFDANDNTNKIFYYRVCVLKESGKVACGKVAKIEIVAQEKDTVPPASPYLSADISVAGVNLNWTKNSEEDFSEYRVLKSLTNSNLSLPAIGPLAIKKSGAENYLDKEVNITSAGNVYYRVCSLDTAGNSACSNIITIENGQIK